MSNNDAYKFDPLTCPKIDYSQIEARLVGYFSTLSGLPIKSFAGADGHPELEMWPEQGSNTAKKRLRPLWENHRTKS